MPKKTVVIDYKACEPEKCDEGICRAMLACEKKILRQEAPYEMPEAKASMCLGCALCVRACSQKVVWVI